MYTAYALHYVLTKRNNYYDVRFRGCYIFIIGMADAARSLVRAARAAIELAESGVAAATAVDDEDSTRDFVSLAAETAGNFRRRSRHPRDASAEGCNMFIAVVILKIIKSTIIVICLLFLFEQHVASEKVAES
jgi:hypothetical protein